LDVAQPDPSSPLDLAYAEDLRSRNDLARVPEPIALTSSVQDV
jgi:hypothetical protein